MREGIKQKQRHVTDDLVYSFDSSRDRFKDYITERIVGLFVLFTNMSLKDNLSFYN